MGSQIWFEADKQSTCRHLQFPSLALLFEKYKQSTQGSSDITYASFDVDNESCVRKQEKAGKPLFCEDLET